MNPTGTPMRLIILAGLAYLGFYVYGLVMGVFSPGEMVGFSIVAGAIVIAVGLYGIWLRRANVDPAEEARVMRDLHDQQQRRGF